MNRLFLACALCGLFAAGCATAPNSVPQSTNNSAATATPSATATPAAQPTRSPETGGAKAGASARGDVTGAYFMAGAVPGDFSDIEHLSLATIDDRGNPAPLNGFIRPKRRSAQDFKLVNPKLDGRSLTFSTSTVSGVGYSFTGTFEKLDNFSENPPPSDEVILRGRLTKTRDGSVVTESDVNFTYSAGG